MRRAKIVCTIGPASSDEATLAALIEAGMDCVRLNFSHGTHAEQLTVAKRVREVADRLGKQVALLQDLPGPKMRLGQIEGSPIQLAPGDEIRLSTELSAAQGGKGAPGRVIDGVLHASVTYDGLARDVHPGARLLLDDGLLEVEVVETDGAFNVLARVIVGGPLSSKKGINLPGVRISAPSFTDADRAHLEVGMQIPVDLIAMSFVRGPDDVQPVRDALRARGLSQIPVLAKIEKPEAVTNLSAIIDAFDGVMVARGDLGVELGPAKVPLAQKQAIDETNAAGKLVIVATQMLDSMIRNPRPTRAEASDVANAVLDNADALMLSGETAVGRYPLETVKMMDAIIREMEGSLRYRDAASHETLAIETVRAAMARAALAASQGLSLAAIGVVTLEGRVAELLSEYRPSCPIVAVTPRPECARKLAVYWGVLPVVRELDDATDKMIEIVAGAVKECGFGRPGDVIGITLAIPAGTTDGTNLLHLHRV